MHDGHDRTSVAADADLDCGETGMREPAFSLRIRPVPLSGEVVHHDRRARDDEPEDGVRIALRPAAVDEDQVERGEWLEDDAPVSHQYMDVGVVREKVGCGRGELQIELHRSQPRAPSLRGWNGHGVEPTTSSVVVNRTPPSRHWASDAATRSSDRPRDASSTNATA
jgi:hypothetical protein